MGVYTYQQAIDRIRYLGDLVGETTTHPDATLAIEINASWRDLRAKLFAAGSAAFIARETFTVAGGASSDYCGTIIIPSAGWPAGKALAAIKRINVLVGSKWKPLDEVTLDDMCDWQDRPVGEPEAFCVIGQDAESGSGDVARLLVIALPATDQSYKFELLYLAEWPEYEYDDVDANVSTDIPGWDWVIQDVLRKCFTREGDPDRVALHARESVRLFVEIVNVHRALRTKSPRQRRKVRRDIAWRGSEQ